MLRLSYMFVLSSVVACTAANPAEPSDDDPDDSEPVCVDRGFTDCNGDTCQPGQYCEPDGSFSDCANGCVSDTNCACNQTCQKNPGEQVGICSSGPGPGPGPDDPDPAVADCMNACSFIDSQQCFGAGDLDACWSRCEDSTAGNIQTFLGCVINEIECSGYDACIAGL